MLTVHWFPWGRMGTIILQALIAMHELWLVQNTTVFILIKIAGNAGNLILRSKPQSSGVTDGEQGGQTPHPAN